MSLYYPYRQPNLADLAKSCLKTGKKPLKKYIEIFNQIGARFG